MWKRFDYMNRLDFRIWAYSRLWFGKGFGPKKADELNNRSPQISAFFDASCSGSESGERRSDGTLAQMPRLFSGCCAYSYRKYLQHGPMTMEEFIEKAVSLRVDGVDMTGYYFNRPIAAYLASLRHLAYRNGVAFSGAACGASMVQADAAKRAEAANGDQEVGGRNGCAGRSASAHLRRQVALGRYTATVCRLGSGSHESELRLLGEKGHHDRD